MLEDVPNKTYLLVFETGEEVSAGLRQFAGDEKLSAAHVTAIGAFRDATLGSFNLERRDYDRIPLHQQLEVLALTGNVARHEGDVMVHAHAVLGCHDVSARGGHLLEAHVRPPLEVMLAETPQHLARQHDPRTGLALLNPDR